MRYQIEKKQNGKVFFGIKDEEYEVPEYVWERYMETQKKQKDEVDSEERLVSLLNNKIVFNPFQYKPYFKLITNMNNNNNFIFIADEVGVGKTYETGIIISELLYQRKISFQQKNAVLIVCPGILMRKWQEVLLVSFGIPARIVTKVEDSWGISIISYDSVSVKTVVAISDNIQLTIFDESHKMTGTNRAENCKEIAQKSNIRVLLSATPDNGKGNTLDLQKAVLQPNGIETIKFDGDNEFVNRTRKIELREKDIPTVVENIQVENTMAFDLMVLGDMLLKGKAALYRTIWMNMVISSPKTAERYIDGLKKWQYKGDEEIREILRADLQKQILEELQNATDEEDEEELRQQAEEQSFEQISSEDINKIKQKINDILEKRKNDLYTDTKVDALKELIINRIEESRKNEKNSKYFEKLVIFVRYEWTADFLKNELEQIIKDSFVVSGREGLEEKQQNYERFKKAKGPAILIITNVACEGLDMDFSNGIVNYDMDYNPVVLEQRRGRIDRFECPEGKDKNYIYNFIVKGIDPASEEIEAAVNSDERIQELKRRYSYSIYGHVLYKLRNIRENTGNYYRIIDNKGKRKDYADKPENDAEIKSNAYEQVKAIFKRHNYSTDFEFIKKEYKQLIEEEIARAVKHKFEGEYVENVLHIDSGNAEILKQLFMGGNIASDRIYQRQ